VFYFFSHRTKYFEILPTHIGTFGFAPTAQADTQAKPKEPILPPHQMTVMVI
jgi:hypothetical protein